MNDRPTFGSLFAGIGGLDLGLERAGWECRWQVERDEFCRRVLAKHWPDVRRYGDVREFGEGAERVDLICGGFPCQPVSVAGKRLRQADERWLWPEFERVIRALRPRLVLVENVPGLLHGGVGDVLGRDRVWIVAYAHGDEWSADRREPDAGANGRNNAPRRLTAGAIPDANGYGAMGHDRDRGHAERHEATAVQERGNVFAGAIGSTWWAREPAVARLVDGLPDGLDRWRERYGNAVVPQVAQWIGERLLEVYRKSP